MKEQDLKNRFRRRYLSLLFIAGFLILVSSQNTQTVTVHFLFWSTSLSLVLLIYLTFIFGIMSGLLFKSLNNMYSRRVEKKQSEEPELVEKKDKKSILQSFKRKKLKE